MSYYAGLDVSLKEISICVVDNDGEVVRFCRKVVVT
jgi:predicted NBD/HSP70 family sugar kinase